MRVMVDGAQAGNRSGTGEYTVQLAAWLPKVAPDLEVMFAWPEDVAPPDEALTLPVRRRARGLAYVARRGKWLRGADLIHYPASIGHMANLRSAVVTVHDVSCLVDPSWFRWQNALYYRFMITRSARNAAVVIADSQATARDLEQRVGVDPKKIRVIPLGVEPGFRPAPMEDVAEIRREMALPERFLLFVGTHEPRKNLPRLVEAFSRVADKIPHSLVLAGRSGWKCESLQRTLAGLKERNRALTPGFVAREKLPALLTAAEGFVWPSLYEGFGLPPLEAMACGTPVLTSNTSSLPEVTGDAALLVDPEDTEAIARGVANLATDGALRQALRERGMKRAREFTWARTAELTAEVYRSTISKWMSQ